MKSKIAACIFLAILFAASTTISSIPANAAGTTDFMSGVPAWSGKIIHYELFVTDAYIDVQSGIFPASDPSDIAGWPYPVYIWGFTDVDPGGLLTAPNYLNLQQVPPGAGATIGTPVGNAKFPAPFLEASVGDDVYITVHNRGFFQENQAVQDEHTLHLHGIHAQSQYDGFPESAGGYSEQLLAFWQNPMYGGQWSSLSNLRNTSDPNSKPLDPEATKLKDDWWNSLDALTQQYLMKQWQNLGTTPTITNALSPGGGIYSQFDTTAFPPGTPGEQVENESQYTYYFRADHAGTNMYHCHVTAAEHVQMGMYGALVIRPNDYYPKDFNAPLTKYDATSNFYYDINRNGRKDLGEPLYNDVDKSGTVSVRDVRLGITVLRLGETTATYLPFSTVTIRLTVYGVGTGTDYDKEYTFLYSEFDPNWHYVIEGKPGYPADFYPPDWKPELWFVNGRTFPQTVFAFQYNALEPNPNTNGTTMWYRPEPSYNTYVSVTHDQKFLERLINMGYEDDAIHQHGWHFKIVGSDNSQWKSPIDKYTLDLASGETYDVITLANPVYGVTNPAGSPLANKVSPPNGTQWRQVYPIHDHDDYRVTTNGIYPGGALVLIEATGVPGTPPGLPTWYDPYTGNTETLPPPPP